MEIYTFEIFLLFEGYKSFYLAAAQEYVFFWKKFHTMSLSRPALDIIIKGFHYLQS